MLPYNKVDINARVDSEVGNFLDHAGWAVNVNDSLMNSHFESVPGFGTLSAGGLSGGDVKDLSGDADGTSGFVTLVL